MPQLPCRPTAAQRIFLIPMLASIVAFGPLSIDMYLPAIPGLAREFGVGEPVIQFSLTAFLVGMAAGQLVYGPLSDRYGRKPLLYIGLSLYTVMTFACALASSAHALILLRALEALGACAGIVISRATIRDLFTPREVASIFSLLMLVMGVAPVLAPLIGGYIAAWWGWRAIFWLLGALSALCLLVMSFCLPETHHAAHKKALVASFMSYGGLLRHRQFMGYALAGAVAQAGMFAYITGSPFVFIELFHVPANAFGWIFGLNAIGLIGMAQVNLFLLRRYTLDQVLRRSLTLVALDAAFLFAAGLLHLGVWAVGTGLLAYLSVLGLTFPNTAAGALSEQGKIAGSASALLGTIQFGAGVLASTLVNALHNGSSFPMTGVIGVCGIASLIAYRTLINHQNAAEASPETVTLAPAEQQ